MMAVSLRTVALVVGVAISLSACDTFPADHQLGISLGPEESIVLRYVLCADELVESVTLYLNRDDDPFLGNDGDTVLWRITSRAGARAGSYVVGQTPKGFVENVDLSLPRQSNVSLGIQIDTNTVHPRVRFRVSDLRRDRI